MEAGTFPHRGTGPRHSILDLAPLELECMSALWPLSEGTVRDIHRQLTASRPRAYTTIMTIMDRLAQKGIVTRRKVGRAYRYQPNLSADEARMSAVEKIVTGFFDGSADALAAHLVSAAGTARSFKSSYVPPEAPRPDTKRDAAEASPSTPVDGKVDGTDTVSRELDTRRLDETLL